LWRHELETSRTVLDAVRSAEEMLRHEDGSALPPFFPMWSTTGQKSREPGELEALLVYRSYVGVHAVTPQDGELRWHVLLNRSLGNWLAEVDRYLKPKAATEKPWPAAFFEGTVSGSLAVDGTMVLAINDYQLPPYPNWRIGRAPKLADYLRLRSKSRRLGEPEGMMARLARDRKYYLMHEKPRQSPIEVIDSVTGKLKILIDTDNVANLPRNYAFIGPVITRAGALYSLAVRTRDVSDAAQFVCPTLGVFYSNWPPRELRLLCINPRAAKVVSDDKLADWPNANNAVRQRLRAIHLIVQGDTLFCPTDAGVLTAFDLLTTKRTWTYTYREDADKRPLPEGRRLEFGPDPWWAAAKPAIAKNKIVFTAADSRQIHCLDLKSGIPVWKSPQTKDDLYFAGVIGDTVVNVGRKTIRGLNLATGKTDWSLPTAMPAGRGDVRGDVYYLPLQATAPDKPATIAAIDVARGRVLANYTLPKNEIAGNLLLSDEWLISQSAYDIAAYPMPKIRPGN
jgi:hypothetical protein